MKGFDWRRGRWGAILLLVVAIGLVAMFLRSEGRPTGSMPKIAAGANLVVVKADGSLWAMGRNTRGVSIGDGTTNDRPHLVRLGKDTNWVDVARGVGSSLGLKSDGSLWAWGVNRFGQLGDGTTQDRKLPVRIGTDHDWVQIAAGLAHGCALKSDGTLWAWGVETSAQLGIGKQGTRHAPVQVGQDRDWKLITAAPYCTLAVKSDGTLWAWGTMPFRYIASVDQPVPLQIGKAANWKLISAGGFHVQRESSVDGFVPYYAGLKADGGLWGWKGSFLTLGYRSEQIDEVRIGEGTDWTMVSAGPVHVLALKADGSLWAWGDNSYGQLGDGTTDSAASTRAAMVPVRVGRRNDWVMVAAGNEYSVALRADGSLWAWGRRLVISESASKAWLRKMITRYKVPIKMSPLRTMDLVPVKIADLGSFPVAGSP